MSPPTYRFQVGAAVVTRTDRRGIVRERRHDATGNTYRVEHTSGAASGITYNWHQDELDAVPAAPAVRPVLPGGPSGWVYRPERGYGRHTWWSVLQGIGWALLVGAFVWTWLADRLS
jgi:hypothetical protein